MRTEDFTKGDRLRGYPDNSTRYADAFRIYQSIRVVERHSFSAAARDLHLALKTVSKQIALLERALGTTLFERNTRYLRITGEGRAIAERARVALAVLGEVQELATGASQELNGIIRLTAPMPFGRKFVAPAIHDFCRPYTRVGFDLRLSDQVPDLYSGDLDLAIRMGELADSRLVARRIADNRRILAASPAYLESHGQPVQPEELEQHNCLVFAYPGLLQSTWPLRKGRREMPIAVSGRRVTCGRMPVAGNRQGHAFDGQRDQPGQRESSGHLRWRSCASGFGVPAVRCQQGGQAPARL